ncbi:MAG: DUF4846 domain-containing protein [Saprospiraceae bacterium]
MKNLFCSQLLLIFILTLFSCESSSQGTVVETLDPTPAVTQKQVAILQPEGQTILSRFNPPHGFKRTATEVHSFGDYLRQLPLKPHGSKVHYYNGEEKNRTGVYIGVVDMEIGTRDLQQCADAVMRLRGEYLFQEKKYDDIRFNFTNGFDMTFAKWRQGYRVKINGNKVDWVKSQSPSSSYSQFRSYMNMVFAYAGTLSLSRELKAIPIAEIQIGDVFIQGGSPGHAIIVADMAINEEGEKRFLLLQSYMPAQDIQVLQNPNQHDMSPWYALPDDEEFATPEWVFTTRDLKRF